MQAYADGCRFSLWSWRSHGSDCLGPRGAESAKNGKIENVGNYLVDQKGMTLYIFDKDKEAGKSACNGGCAKLWPPFAPEAGQAKATEPLSIITRDDGTKQYAYKGKPLYYYDKDSKAGDTTGDAVGKVWWVAKP
jgi:predicted lipoprotein with Yx(FWY)xxD motif